jgi:hypothetical protein
MITRTRLTSHRIVHWTFQRGDDQVTCGIDQDSYRPSYTLSLVPNASVDAAVVETFESAVAALQRHAGIAAELRELGWTLVAYTGRRSTDRPACEPTAA